MLLSLHSFKRLVILSLFIAGFVAAGAVGTASAQFSFDSAASVTIQGRVVESQNKQPLNNAMVTVRTKYDEYKTFTDAEGYYTLEVKAGREMNDFELVFSHPDYREKYFHTAFQPVLRADLNAQVTDANAKVKYQKTNLELGCGQNKALITKTGDTFACGFDCSGAGLSLRLPAGNEFTFSAKGGFTLKINDEKIEVKGLKNTAVTFGATAVMFKR